MTDTTSFPRLAARTMNFTLGAPRSITVAPDGSRAVFLRTSSGTSRRHDLWVMDLPDGTERRVADAGELTDSGAETITAEERARRERMRVSTAGVVAYSTDRDLTVAAFALSSRLFVADLLPGAQTAVRRIEVPHAVVDPRLDPTGSRVAYVADRAVYVVDLDGDGEPRRVAGPAEGEGPEVVWGLAEFAAAEELDRSSGYWWSPDGSRLLVERYDETPVPVFHVADPAFPERTPNRLRYPAAGRDNALVSLYLVDAAGSEPRPVAWSSDREIDGAVLEYLADVAWTDDRLLLSLFTRDQRQLDLREVDPADGTTSLVRRLTDPDWVDVVPGLPATLQGGAILHAFNDGDARRLAVDGQPFSPAGLQVEGVQAVRADGTGVFADVVVSPGSTVLAELRRDGEVRALTDPDGVALAVVGGLAGGSDVVVAQQRTTTGTPGPHRVLVDGEEVATLGSTALAPPYVPQPRMLAVGERELPAAVLFPRGHRRGSKRLPVLMCPYGGPHGRMVTSSSTAYLQTQWFADQGFCVVIADGRGMAGRGPAWDRLARNDFIGTIDDQAEVVAEVGRLFPDDVDTSKVAMRGWSFGGYISALAVLKRPDVFHAGIAGAPVTDWHLYDTAYTERYLGHPDENAAVYETNGLLGLAKDLTRPLQLIHGTVDDNVVVAHTLRLSQALLAAGKPHEVVPLTGTTHMPASEVVAENLLLLQIDFLRRALDL